MQNSKIYITNQPGRYILAASVRARGAMLFPGRSRKQMITQQQRNNRRRRANPRQLAYLRKRFLEDPKPDQEAREQIGRVIDMTPRSVQIWFQNNRAKTKDQERKLALHGKMFTMTSRACSESVTCIHAGFGGQAYASPEDYDSDSSSIRYFTPPPGRSQLTDYSSASTWWGSSSQPELSCDFMDTESSHSGDLEGAYSKPRAWSAANVNCAKLAYEGISPLASIDKDVDGQPGFSEILDVDGDPLGFLGARSPVSMVESFTPDSCDSDEFTRSMTDLYTELTYADFNSDESPQTVDISQVRSADLMPMSAHSEAGSLETRYSGQKEYLVPSASNLRLTDDLRTHKDEFILIPCSLARIGQYLYEDGERSGQEITAQYSPSRQILRIVLTDSVAGQITTLEKDVLQFPSPRAIQRSSYGYSHIIVEVFGTPRITTEDFFGQSLPVNDPTDGEIHSVHQCRFFGDLSAQLSMLQRLELSNGAQSATSPSDNEPSWSTPLLSNSFIQTGERSNCVL